VPALLLFLPPALVRWNAAAQCSMLRPGRHHREREQPIDCQQKKPSIQSLAETNRCAISEVFTPRSIRSIGDFQCGDAQFLDLLSAPEILRCQKRNLQHCQSCRTRIGPGKRPFCSSVNFDINSRTLGLPEISTACSS
jgi:hypothetical protein